MKKTYHTTEQIIRILRAVETSGQRVACARRWLTVKAMALDVKYSLPLWDSMTRTMWKKG